MILDKPIPPPFRYIGSDRKLLKSLLPYIPDHDVRLIPFLGSASLPLALEPAPIEYWNDLDSGIAAIFWAMKYKPQEFAHLIENTIHHESLFDECKEIVVKKYGKGWQSLDEEERLTLADAKRYILLGSLFTNEQQFRVFYLPKRDPLGSPYHFLPEDIVKRIKKVFIRSLDFQKFLESHVGDRRDLRFWAYLDPPFVVAEENTYYQWRFTEEDHIRMFKTLYKLEQENDNFQFLIKYDSHPLIHKIFEDYGDNWFIKEIDVNYTLKRIAKKELRITNYPLDSFEKPKPKKRKQSTKSLLYFMNKGD